MITDLSKRLADCGILPTPQRLAVYRSLVSRRDHPSVDAVFADLRRKLPTLSKTTVYSTMQRLAEKGLILTLHGDGDEVRYDGFTEFHAHFRCRACGKVFDVMLGKTRRRPFAKLPEGFAAEGEELTCHGLCPACKNKNNRKGKENGKWRSGFAPCAGMCMKAMRLRRSAPSAACRARSSRRRIPARPVMRAST